MKLNSKKASISSSKMLKGTETGFSDLLTKKNAKVVTKFENYLINVGVKKLPTAAKAVSKEIKGTI